MPEDRSHVGKLRDQHFKLITSLSSPSACYIYRLVASPKSKRRKGRQFRFYEGPLRPEANAMPSRVLNREVKRTNPIKSR